MRAASFRSLGIATVLLLAAAVPAGAQVVVVPDFVVSSAVFGDHIQDVDVAVGTDGTITFIWGEYSFHSIAGDMAVTKQFSADGVALGPAVRVDTSKHVFGPMISSDTRGGYVAGWQWIISGQQYAYFGQLLDGAGAPTGEDFRVDFENSGATQPAGVAGLPSGSVFTWKQLAGKLWGRLYDTQGQQVGDAFEIGTIGAGFVYDVKATPTGGFVATWTNTWINPVSWARAYDADGQPLGDVFSIGPADFHAQHTAVSPDGTVATVGYRPNTALGNSEVWLVRFTQDGQTLSARRVEIPAEGVSIGGDVSIDALGKIYVSWSEYQIPGEGARAPRARAFDPDGNPIVFGFWPTLKLANEMATAVLPNGNFVNFWYRNGVARANIVEIPPGPGVVCGDGVVTSGFEECDDGAANSDTAPDACRTNCLLPTCGDQVVDSSEQCDDGNGESCDGCSAACMIEAGHVCGDGVVEPGCGEQCDDGNTAARDGCDYACQVEACYACNGSPSVCAPKAPPGACRAPTIPGKSQLILKNYFLGSDRDTLKWKWGKGAATSAAALGNPLSTTDYELCVYDGTSLVIGSRATAGGNCDGKPCWKAIGGGGFKYQNKGLYPNGLQKLTIKAGPDGKAKILVKGKGSWIRMPSLPLSQNPMVTVQLINGEGECWRDTYSAPARANESGIFKDKGD
jgi:cysteine-rich repeat protein